jgi:serine/threonine-protein kinase RsbW
VNTDLTASSLVMEWFQQLNEPPLNNTIWWQCQTLLQEAFINIVEHAHRGLPQETPIVLEATRNNDFIEILIWSYGSAFDIEQKLQETPDIEKIVGERGRGLKIMSLLADELSYERVGERYCLYIKKHYSRSQN